MDEPIAYENYQATGPPGSGEVLDIYTDRQGSVSLIVDPATATIKAENTYDSFGNRTQTGSLQQRYAFTGREADDESGLMYYRARHYDTALGQFIQRDPVGFAAGDLNLYAYVGSDPYNWSDPSGLNTTLLTVQQTENDRKTRSGALLPVASGSLSASFGIMDYLLFLAAVLQGDSVWNTVSDSNDDPDSRGVGDNGGPPLDENEEDPDPEEKPDFPIY